MKIFIGCSASNDIPSSYIESANYLLEEIFKRDNSLVFGGGSGGLMGLVYKICKEHNREVIAVTTEDYVADLNDIVSSKEYVVSKIVDRTELLIKQSEALLFLPGGTGTMQELMTAIEAKKGKEFNKPIIIWNMDGFYDELIGLLNKLCLQGFSSKLINQIFVVANTAEEVLTYLN